MRLFAPLGVSSTLLPQGIEICRAPLSEGPYIADLVDTPDLAQAIVMTCAALGKSCHLRGLSTLRVKETDRLLAMQECLAQVGIEAEIIDDSIRFAGNVDTQAKPHFATYQDHRMAMSLSILSPTLSEMYLTDAEVVGKSFPHFWEALSDLGYEVCPSD